MLTIYQRGGGKVARHGWVPEATSVGAISYVGMQTWAEIPRRLGSQLFRSNSQKATSHLELPRFTHLPAACFLYYIPSANIKLGENALKLELATQFFETVYQPLAGLKPLILKGIKALASRKETTNTDD